MKKDVKSAIADILKQEKIEYIFGYTGGHIMHMWEAASNAGIKTILNKQEGNAVYMADAYARLTKKPSVVLGTTGPGVQNMTTGLASAYLDSVPIIAIGAGVPTYSFGKNALQESSGRGRAPEQRLIFKACCKEAMLAPSPEAVPDMVRDAFRTAMSGRLGPVYVEVPSDFWSVGIKYERILPEKYKNLNIPKCHQKDCIKIAEALYRSKHPLIVIGEGADEVGIENKLKRFLDKVKIPFAASPLGKNFIDEYNQFYLSGLRSHGGKPRVYDYMEKSDFILFLGDRMHQWELDWMYDRSVMGKAKLAQVDLDYNEIGRVYPVDFSAVGSISSFLASIGAKRHKNSKKLLKEINLLHQKYPRKKRYSDGNGINPLNLNTIVEEFASEDAVIVCDTGYTGSMGILKFRTKLSQKFLHADKNSPMGYAVPAGIGAALATGKEVISFVGDGGFQMSLNELGTAMNYHLKVIYVIENNGGCISIVNFHSQVYGHHCAAAFKNPNYIKIAEGYGMKGFCVETTNDFEKAFKQAQKEKNSVVIDAKIDQSRMIWE